MIAVSAMQAMTDLRLWVRSIVARRADKGMIESEVVMVAHYGSCHDHILLMKTMMNCGVDVARLEVLGHASGLPAGRPAKSTIQAIRSRVRVRPVVQPHQHDAFSDAESKL